MKALLLIVISTLIPSICFAADPVAAVNQVTNTLNTWETSAAVGSLALALEFMFRLIPTQKPLSWAWVVANLFAAVGALFTAIATGLDKILPQNTASK